MSDRINKWSGGLAEWVDGDAAFLSVAFTWRLPEAYSRAVFHRAAGRRVRAGGPAVAMLPDYLEGVAEIPPKVRGKRSPGSLPDAVTRHNPLATFASRGCDVGCEFCLVPWMEGRTFTMLPDFVPRPILCDNNLSGLPAGYQQYIIDRYRAFGVQLVDANSGFEPRTFDDEVFARWRGFLRGPWRFAFDKQNERSYVERVMQMLRRAGVGPRRQQVYVLIGNEPQASCLERLAEVIAWGGEPYAQPEMKLTALKYRPWVRFDWTERRLREVQRWVNGRFWKYTSLDQYRASIRSRRGAAPQEGLLL